MPFEKLFGFLIYKAVSYVKPVQRKVCWREQEVDVCCDTFGVALWRTDIDLFSLKNIYDLSGFDLSAREFNLLKDEWPNFVEVKVKDRSYKATYNKFILVVMPKLKEIKSRLKSNCDGVFGALMKSIVKENREIDAQLKYEITTMIELMGNGISPTVLLLEHEVTSDMLDLLLRINDIKYVEIAFKNMLAYQYLEYKSEELTKLVIHFGNENMRSIMMTVFKPFVRNLSLIGEFIIVSWIFLEKKTAM